MKNEEIVKDEIDKKLDLKELFFSHPSQRDKKKKDFTEYSRIDINLLKKKREREIEENKDTLNDINKEENKKGKNKEKKDNSFNDNLPSELIELIKKAKDNGPFTAKDFEKYKTYKKLNINNKNKNK